MFVTICRSFHPDEDAVAGYGNRIRVKYTAKWGAQIAGPLFQTRSDVAHHAFFHPYLQFLASRLINIVIYKTMYERIHIR
jgi:hypothetical protein